MPVHVAIHDVSPVWTSEIEAALTLCAAVDAKPALLVVPNFHGRAPLLEDEPFCKRLRDLQTNGHEIFLHGFFHQSRGPRRRGPVAARLARFYTQRVISRGEAEMSDVSAEQGQLLVTNGETVLREAGLRIDGYVPPAWSMPAWLLAFLSDRGCRFTEDHFRIHDPSAGLTRASVLLNWASRSPARLLSTVAFCRGAKHLRALMPTRIAIHPADMHFLTLRREIEGVLAWARGDIEARAADLF